MNNLSLADILNRYGRSGVEALKRATPVDTGNTASRWGYKISTGKKGASITWTNDSKSNGVPIVILLQYGHSTRNGGYVSGVDFINPALRKIFNEMSDTIWKEVVKL